MGPNQSLRFACKGIFVLLVLDTTTSGYLVIKKSEKIKILAFFLTFLESYLINKIYRIKNNFIKY